MNIPSERPQSSNSWRKTVQISAGIRQLRGRLFLPDDPKGLVLTSRAPGLSTENNGNRILAKKMTDIGFSVLLVNYFTSAERETYSNYFNYDLLTRRLRYSVQWGKRHPLTAQLPIITIGAGMKAEPAIRAMKEETKASGGLVLWGAGPNFPEHALRELELPVLFLLGSRDQDVWEENKWAFEQVYGEKAFEILFGRSHLFWNEESLEDLASRVQCWWRNIRCTFPTSLTNQ